MGKFQKYFAFILSLTLVLSYSIPSSNAIAASTTKPEKDLYIKHTGENSTVVLCNPFLRM